MVHIKPTHSLAFKQALTVFIVSMLLGMAFSINYTLVDLHREQNRVEEHYRFKLMQSYTDASQAAYRLNPILAEQVANSLMNDPAIVHVQILDDFNDVLIQRQRKTADDNRFIRLVSSYIEPPKETYQTSLHQPNSEKIVGSLLFSINVYSIAQQFVQKHVHIILLDFLRTCLLTTILLTFFYYKLSLPIIRLIRWVRSLQEKQHASPESQFKRNNELRELATTFHRLWVEREEAETQLNRLAFYDTLTGLSNRSMLMTRLSTYIEQASRDNQEGALLYLDLDRFKTINDSLGHTIGDELLIAVAKRIEQWADYNYLIARIGGDEFAIILPLTTHLDLEKTAQSLIDELSAPYTIDTHQLYCTVSIGIATYPSDNNVNIDILRQADTALYRSKVSGGNSYKRYQSEMQSQVNAFLDLEKGLHQALANQELELYYQPQVNERFEIVGAEALIRWNHPTRGLLPPGVFMSIAEETGQIIPIGRWILETACRKLAQWKKDNRLPVTFRRLAINISPMQFAQDNFIEQVTQIIDEVGISGKNIELEITENLLLENMESAVKKMAKLKEFDIHLSIDDFGTGYSSLRYLKHLDVDILKIDRSFVTKLHQNDNDKAIVDTILMIAKRLNLGVIAEGVEDSLELNVLKDMGCKQFQGYLFDKPLTEEQLLNRFAYSPYTIDGLLELDTHASRNI
ncbi:EAL domain-containing protein [Vibrio sp. CAIM 722]|uniref:EAL domain-containing protein n=1 Tax=Vibrio eleionomae TaxID=2653505 RepID=A0A7X4RTU0_9VIBR|nr:EAL domain-containing protein [Vibrio eleionomae]MZI92605.1 EAL domain-containing protein [Vibrio eleionomae]